MPSIKPWSLFVVVSVTLLNIQCHAFVVDKKPIPFGNPIAQKRNLGGELKDWYLAHSTNNYFCTDTGRLVPVDPETGHMLLKGLRKRDGWFDDLVGHSHSTEHGLCRHPKWVLPPHWTQPIPVTQLEAQYPWVTVDDRGQIQFRQGFRDWLQQRAAARSSGQGMVPAAGGAAPGGGGGGGGGGAGAGVVPDGGVGHVPPSQMNVPVGMAGTSGLGQNAFGNGVMAGAAAHV